MALSYGKATIMKGRTYSFTRDLPQSFLDIIDEMCGIDDEDEPKIPFKSEPQYFINEKGELDWLPF